MVDQAESKAERHERERQEAKTNHAEHSPSNKKTDTNLDEWQQVSITVDRQYLLFSLFYWLSRSILLAFLIIALYAFVMEGAFFLEAFVTERYGTGQ